MIEKLAKLTDTSFGNVIVNLREKIEDESKKEEFLRFIEDWFEHQKMQKERNNKKAEPCEHVEAQKREIKVTMTYPGPDGQERQHVIYCNNESETASLETENTAEISAHNPQVAPTVDEKR